MAESEGFPEESVAVVFGATGGIGGALIEALGRSCRFSRVDGFSRASEPRLDLLDEASIAAIARTLLDRGGEIRLIIDATGVLEGQGTAPEKSWRRLDASSLASAFALNAIGPALLMKHCLPLLPGEGKAVFATLSARVGSIADNRLGGWYGYRASKAALNQLVRTAAVELGRQKPEAICVALHPGTVATTLSSPYPLGALRAQTPTEAASRLIEVIDALTADDSGGFRDHRGEVVPW